MEARRLEVGEIVATAERLSARIEERFGGRGISRIAQDLVELAHETEGRLAESRRPNWLLRGLAATLILVGLLVLALSATRVRLGSDISGIDEWLSVTQDGIQDIVFVGIAVAFLVTLEGRRRRRTMLAALHELRSVAHVIDMHQLTKDPDSVMRPELATPKSPERSLDRYQLNRYLDYCSEMLSLTSKLAALYAQAANDQLVLAAVREIEDLSGAMSSKVWQKIMILDALDPSGPSRTS